MSGYLPFKASGLFFRRLTSQHPLASLTHGIGLRLFNEAHILSKCWLRRYLTSPEPPRNVYVLFSARVYTGPPNLRACRLLPPTQGGLWALLLHNPAQFTSLVVRQAPCSSEELRLR